MAVGFPAKTDFATGDVLTATNVNDITGTLNLLQSTLYPAGRNKLINGDFFVNQRAFTSTTSDNTYTFDRWQTSAQDGTSTFSAQTFTPGAAPVTGYEGANFLRVVTTGQTAASASTQIRQRIENVRTFANKTVLISLWARATSGTPKIAIEAGQNFGSGGSASVNTYAGQITLSTSWVRYSVTVAVPSISGKTIGTSSYLGTNLWMSAGTDFNARTGSLGIQSNTFEIWGVQIEDASTGSTASPFQTASGSIAGELALCQRYYWRNQATAAGSQFYIGTATSTTTVQMTIPLPVKMRANANPLEYSTLSVSDGVASTVVTSVALGFNSDATPAIIATVASGLTQYRPYILIANASANAYIAFSAEL